MDHSSTLSGVVAATITPLDASFAPDVSRLARHCRMLLDRGCDGINLLGTTGEAASLSVAQRLDVMRAIADAALPLERFMVGTGASALDDAVVLTREAVRLGYHGALVIPPFYFKDVDDDGLFAFFGTLIERVGSDDLRMYLYHFPAMSGVRFGEPVIARLLDAFPDVVAGIKDSSGDVAYARAIARRFPGFAVFPSSETTLGDGRRDGFAGCISATANVTSSLAARAWRDERPDENLAAVRSAMTCVPLVAAVKYVTGEIFLDPNLARVSPPLRRLTADETTALDAALGSIDAYRALRTAATAP